MFLLIDYQPLEKERLVMVRHEPHIRRNATWLSVHDAENKQQVKIKNRQTYPGTFCKRQPDGSVCMGYGTQSVQFEDEFLHIQWGVDGSIRVQRDVFCTLPLFYGLSEGVFVVSNEYTEVLERLPHLTLDQEKLCKNLLTVTPATPYTLWKEIGVLGERETLWFKDGLLTVLPPAPRSWIYASELAPTNARAFPEILTNRFTRFIDTRLAGRHVAFELSGGLDSSLLPLYMAAQGYGTSAPAGTLLQFDSTDQARQQLKINDLELHTALRSRRIALDPQRHYPLGDMLSQNALKPFDPMHGPYQAAKIEYIDYFKSLGVSVVVTGGGGDQVLENRPHPSLLTPEQRVVTGTRTQFLTEKCQVPAIDQDMHTPIPTLLPKTIVLDNVSQANTFINRDIWPVSPFYDVALFNFCQALPVQFRANKNIFRAYFEAHTFPESLYMGPNEDFGTFFNACISSGVYDALVAQLAENSITQKLGYVDSAKLYELYGAIRNGESSTALLFSIYTWIEIELNLQLTKNWSTEA